MSANSFIAVHGGAGFHPTKSEKDVKKALRDACSCALLKLKTHSDNDNSDTCALGMVEDAISSLEDTKHLNAGYGSNLTLNGTVECDAAIMAGRSSDFGSVGAVSGVKNPIRLARAILEYSHKVDELGRVAPMTLVSDGARAFALSYPDKVQLQSADCQVAPQAREQWRKWKARLDAPAGSMIQPKADTAFEESDDESSTLQDIQDTVGAVAWHAKDGIAAGVSSGGMLLKFPGRIGEAAVYGSGCWVEQLTSSRRGVGCSVSGTGEYIVRANLARKVGEAVHAETGSAEDAPDPHEVLQRILAEDLWNTGRQRGEAEPCVGVLLLVVEEEDDDVSARLWCAFTTPSMAIAYSSLHDPKPKAMILRRPSRESGSDPDKPHIYITALTL